MKKRLIEIDFIKGLAVIAMVIFHYFYLATQMNVKSYPIDRGILKCLADFSHNTFIIISGLNLGISIQNKEFKNYFPSKLKRGIELIVYGCIISIATKLEFGDSYVKFGIYHFMGVALIIASILGKNKLLSVNLGILILVASIFLKKINGNIYRNCLSMPLTCFISGIMNVKYNSLDHFSLIPYLGYYLIGVGISNILYKTDENGKSRNFKFLDIIDKYKDTKIVQWISYLGKNTLPIYFIHFILFYLHFKL